MAYLASYMERSADSPAGYHADSLGPLLPPYILPGAWALGDGMDFDMHIGGTYNRQPAVCLWCSLLETLAGAFNMMGWNSEKEFRCDKPTTPSTSSSSSSSSCRSSSGGGTMRSSSNGTMSTSIHSDLDEPELMASMMTASSRSQISYKQE